MTNPMGHITPEGFYVDRNGGRHYPMDGMKGFYLRRRLDYSGVSGEGIIADGVVFPNGWTVIRWTGRSNGLQSLSHFITFEDMVKAHGHGGRTEIVWLHAAIVPDTDVYRPPVSVEYLIEGIENLLAGYRHSIENPKDDPRRQHTLDQKTIGRIVSMVYKAQSHAFVMGFRQGALQQKQGKEFLKKPAVCPFCDLHQGAKEDCTCNEPL